MYPKRSKLQKKKKFFRNQQKLVFFLLLLFINNITCVYTSFYQSTIFLKSPNFLMLNAKYVYLIFLCVFFLLDKSHFHMSHIKYLFRFDWIEMNHKYV